MNVFHCDLCGKMTHINPPMRAQLGDDGQVVMTTIKRQSIFTGEIEDVQVPKMIELKDKALIISLSAGDETIRKDFCRDCYGKSPIKVAVDKLWAELAKVKSIE